MIYLNLCTCRNVCHCSRRSGSHPDEDGSQGTAGTCLCGWTGEGEWVGGRRGRGEWQCNWSKGGGTGSFTERTVQSPRREGINTHSRVVVGRTAVDHRLTCIRQWQYMAHSQDNNQKLFTQCLVSVYTATVDLLAHKSNNVLCSLPLLQCSTLFTLHYYVARFVRSTSTVTTMLSIEQTH